MSHSLRVALLLIVSGGFMDAYTYLAYDHVFTNAQSGNVVLLAVYLAALDWAQAFKHVPALLAFFPGILAGQAIVSRRAIGGVRSDAAILAVEAVLLLVAAAVGPWLPAAAVTFGIAFVAAMQNTAFKTVDGISYTSVVTTGNLRSMSEALFARGSRGDPEDLRKAKILGAICAGFAIGALAGAVAVPPLGKAAIGLPAMLIALCLVACLRDARRSGI